MYSPRTDTTSSTYDEPTFSATYIGEPNEKEDEFEGMLFEAWKSNYWWEDLFMNALSCTADSPKTHLREKEVWTFNHSGVRPWTGKNFHKEGN